MCLQTAQSVWAVVFAGQCCMYLVYSSFLSLQFQVQFLSIYVPNTVIKDQYSTFHFYLTFWQRSAAVTRGAVCIQFAIIHPGIVSQSFLVSHLKDTKEDKYAIAVTAAVLQVAESQPVVACVNPVSLRCLTDSLLLDQGQCLAAYYTKQANTQIACSRCRPALELIKWALIPQNMKCVWNRRLQIYQIFRNIKIQNSSWWPFVSSIIKCR